jgi:hypothetical protein
VRHNAAEGLLDEDRGRRYRAGEPITDLCRACKAVRGHTVMVADADGRALRVVCDFCGSQHDYRGGGEPRPSVRSEVGPGTPRMKPVEVRGERDRTGAAMNASEGDSDLERVLRRVLREELGLTSVVPADKWQGGELVLRPGRAGLQEKKWPIETFFNKVVMIRNRLRSLEQQVNASELPDEAKLKLQAYVTACYGSLTSFNMLFADEKDHFRGSAGGDQG